MPSEEYNVVICLLPIFHFLYAEEFPLFVMDFSKCCNMAPLTSVTVKILHYVLGRSFWSPCREGSLGSSVGKCLCHQWCIFTIPIPASYLALFLWHVQVFTAFFFTDGEFFWLLEIKAGTLRNCALDMCFLAIRSIERKPLLSLRN